MGRVYLDKENNIRLRFSSDGRTVYRTFRIVRRMEEGACSVCYEACHAESDMGVLKEYYPREGILERVTDEGSPLFGQLRVPEAGKFREGYSLENAATGKSREVYGLENAATGKSREVYGLENAASGQPRQYSDRYFEFLDKRDAYALRHRELMSRKQIVSELSVFIPYFEIYYGCDESDVRSSGSSMGIVGNGGAAAVGMESRDSYMSEWADQADDTGSVSEGAGCDSASGAGRVGMDGAAGGFGVCAVEDVDAAAGLAGAYGGDGTVYIWIPHPREMSFQRICDGIHEAPSADPDKSLELVLRCILSLAVRVCALHSTGMVHGDLKPSNFGFDVLKGEIQTEMLSMYDMDSIYIVGTRPTTLGSPGFMDERTPVMYGCSRDIYSIGAILFYALNTCPEGPDGDGRGRLDISVVGSEGRDVSGNPGTSEGIRDRNVSVVGSAGRDVSGNPGTSEGIRNRNISCADSADREVDEGLDISCTDGAGLGRVQGASDGAVGQDALDVSGHQDNGNGDIVRDSSNRAGDPDISYTWRRRHKEAIRHYTYSEDYYTELESIVSESVVISSSVRNRQPEVVGALTSILKRCLGRRAGRRIAAGRALSRSGLVRPGSPRDRGRDGIAAVGSREDVCARYNGCEELIEDLRALMDYLKLSRTFEEEWNRTLYAEKYWCRELFETAPSTLAVFYHELYRQVRAGNAGSALFLLRDVCGLMVKLPTAIIFSGIHQLCEEMEHRGADGFGRLLEENRRLRRLYEGSMQVLTDESWWSCAGLAVGLGKDFFEEHLEDRAAAEVYCRSIEYIADLKRLMTFEETGDDGRPVRTNMVEWAERTISSGCLSLKAEMYYPEIPAILKMLGRAGERSLEYYRVICLADGSGSRLRGLDAGINGREVMVLLSGTGQSVKLRPFLAGYGSGLACYAGYERYRKTAYLLSYESGRNIPDHILSEYLMRHDLDAAAARRSVQADINARNLEAAAIEELEESLLEREPVIGISCLYEWLDEALSGNKKGLLLMMAGRGMGKSSFCRTIDPLEGWRLVTGDAAKGDAAKGSVAEGGAATGDAAKELRKAKNIAEVPEWAGYNPAGLRRKASGSGGITVVREYHFRSDYRSRPEIYIRGIRDAMCTLEVPYGGSRGIPGSGGCVRGYRDSRQKVNPDGHAQGPAGGEPSAGDCAAWSKDYAGELIFVPEHGYGQREAGRNYIMGGLEDAWDRLLSCDRTLRGLCFAEALNETLEEYEERLQAERLLLVLDGIDEISDMEEFLSFLPEAGRLESGVFILLTCRTREELTDRPGLLRFLDSGGFAGTLEYGASEAGAAAIAYAGRILEEQMSDGSDGGKTTGGRLPGERVHGGSIPGEGASGGSNPSGRAIEGSTIGGSASGGIIPEGKTAGDNTSGGSGWFSGSAEDLGRLFGYRFSELSAYRRMCRLCADFHMTAGKELFTVYMEEIERRAPRSYTDRVRDILVTLVWAGEPLTLRELAFLSGEQFVTYRLLGMLNDLRAILQVSRSDCGNRYELTHAEWEDAVKRRYPQGGTQFRRRCNELLEGLKHIEPGAITDDVYSGEYWLLKNICRIYKSNWEESREQDWLDNIAGIGAVEAFAGRLLDAAGAWGGNTRGCRDDAFGNRCSERSGTSAAGNIGPDRGSTTSGRGTDRGAGGSGKRYTAAELVEILDAETFITDYLAALEVFGYSPTGTGINEKEAEGAGGCLLSRFVGLFMEAAYEAYEAGDYPGLFRNLDNAGYFQNKIKGSWLKKWTGLLREKGYCSNSDGQSGMDIWLEEVRERAGLDGRDGHGAPKRWDWLEEPEGGDDRDSRDGRNGQYSRIGRDRYNGREGSDDRDSRVGRGNCGCQGDRKNRDGRIVVGLIMYLVGRGYHYEKKSEEALKWLEQSISLLEDPGEGRREIENTESRNPGAEDPEKSHRMKESTVKSIGQTGCPEAPGHGHEPAGKSGSSTDQAAIRRSGLAMAAEEYLCNAYIRHGRILTEAIGGPADVQAAGYAETVISDFRRAQLLTDRFLSEDVNVHYLGMRRWLCTSVSRYYEVAGDTASAICWCKRAADAAEKVLTLKKEHRHLLEKRRLMVKLGRLKYMDGDTEGALEAAGEVASLEMSAFGFAIESSVLLILPYDEAKRYKERFHRYGLFGGSQAR